MKFEFTSKKIDGNMYLLMIYKGLFRHYSRVKQIHGKTREKSHLSRDELEKDFKKYYKEKGVTKRSFRKPTFDSMLIEIESEKLNNV